MNCDYRTVRVIGQVEFSRLLHVQLSFVVHTILATTIVSSGLNSLWLDPNCVMQSLYFVKWELDMHQQILLRSINWFWFWRYLTKELIGHLSQDWLWNQAWIRSWNKPILSNEDKVSCSRKQQEPSNELR